MLKDLIEKYYFSQNYNCAETIIRAANEYYELGLNDKEMILVAGFGGGIQTGNICGTLLASVSVLSQKYVEARAHESADIKPVVSSLMKKFREDFGGFTLCKDIKPVYFSKEVRCLDTVIKACDVLENVINEYEASK